MDTQGRAEDLLDRLDTLGMAQGIAEDDLTGTQARQALCSCCSQLATALTCISADVAVLLAEDPVQLRSAFDALKAVSASPQDAAGGRLDAALAQLAAAIDPQATACTSSSSRLKRIELIVATLQAAHILARKQQTKQQQQQRQGDNKAADAVEQLTAAVDCLNLSSGPDDAVTAEIRLVAKLLGVDVSSSTALSVLTEVVQKLQAWISELPTNFFQPLADLHSLDGGQQDVLKEVDAALRQEYTIRRRMLIERIKVTLQSFLWSPRVAEKDTKQELERLIAQCQQQLTEVPDVSLSDVSNVTPADLASVMRKATSGEGSFDAAIKRVVIGKVPDRGGRPEGRSREANMPEWTARRSDSGSGGGGSRGGGGNRGGGRGGGGGSHRGGGGGYRGGGGGGRRGGWGRGGRQ